MLQQVLTGVPVNAAMYEIRVGSEGTSAGKAVSMKASPHWYGVAINTPLLFENVKRLLKAGITRFGPPRRSQLSPSDSAYGEKKLNLD